MTLSLNVFSKGKQITHLMLATLLATALTVVWSTASAAAYSCHVFTAKSAGTEAGMSYSKTYYVPYGSESKCKDINVRNIQNQQIKTDNCATFKVQFFPTSGGSYYNKPKTVCSKGPHGPVVAIATHVLNGTKYRIWHNLENQGWTHTYQIVD